MAKFFHDSDGCVADWDKQAYALLGMHPKTVGDQVFWRHANAHDRFWCDMPPMAGAYDYWDRIKHLNPTILTGAPKDRFDFAADAKREWWLRHFNHSNVIVCLSKDKFKFVERAGDILVDDTPRMIRRWEQAGGVGVLYRDADQALAALRQLRVI